MDTFEKTIIKSAIDVYAGIKNIDTTGITDLKAKIDNISNNQTMILDITSYDLTKSSVNLTYDYVSSQITNSYSSTQTVVTYETLLKNIIIKSFKIITNDGVLTDFKIEICKLFNGVVSPVWIELNKDELYYQVIANTELRFRISVPQTKSLKKIYVVYEN